MGGELSISSTGSSNVATIAPGNFVAQQTEKFSDIYKGLKVLGKGSFGEVILCRDRKLLTQVAVKVISKKNLKKASEREALIKEVNLIKELDHPNIMKVFEFFEDNTHFYIVSELYSGGELFDEIVKRKRFNESDCAAAMYQMLSGINYMHKIGIVHRDLKPENILLETKGSMKLRIIDFGLSTHFDRNANRSMKDRIGTAYYIAPEVLRGTYDEKCDVWSLGVIMYIMLSGCPPFYGNNEKDILKRVEVGKYTFNLPQWTKVGEPAKNLIRKMLFYVPAMRIPANECLEHEWIQRFVGDPNKKLAQHLHLLNKSLPNAQKFLDTGRLGQVAMLYAASKLTEPLETEELSMAFHALDADGKGRLGVEDLTAGYKAIIGRVKAAKTSDAEIEREVKKLLNAVDLDGSGFIEISEFLAVMMNKKTLLKKERLQKAFDKFDTDHSGSITDQELSLMFGADGKIAKSEVSKMIKEIDQDGNGEIDFQEFCAALERQ